MIKHAAFITKLKLPVSSRLLFSLFSLFPLANHTSQVLDNDLALNIVLLLEWSQSEVFGPHWQPKARMEKITTESGRKQSACWACGRADIYFEKMVFSMVQIQQPSSTSSIHLMFRLTDVLFCQTIVLEFLLNCQNLQRIYYLCSLSRERSVSDVFEKLGWDSLLWLWAKMALQITTATEHSPN